MMTDQNGLNSRELWELKQAALKYYKENNVTDYMEEILNNMFFVNPDDVYGYLSTFFESHSKKPVISRLTAQESLDSKGEPALQVDLYVRTRNEEKLVATAVIPSRSSLNEDWKIEDKEADDIRRLESVNTAIAYINNEFMEKLIGLDPSDQAAIDVLTYDFVDELIRKQAQAELDEKTMDGTVVDLAPPPPIEPPAKPKNVPKSPKGKKAAVVNIIPDEKPAWLPPGCELASAVSMAVCQGGAITTKSPLYLHVNQLRHQTAEHEELKLCLPSPVVTILQAGKSGAGKLKCVKEYMITTCPDTGTTFAEGLLKLRQLQAAVFKMLYAKSAAGLRYVSDVGALCPVLDRPDQGITLIQDAAQLLNYNAGIDYNIILNLNGRDIFDYEKGKYEVMTGQLKTGVELVDFYADILHRYPSVIAIIDPMRHVERMAWMSLCEKVCESVYVFSEAAYPRADMLKHCHLGDDFRTSGVVLQYDQMTTVTDLVAATKRMTEHENRMMLSCGPGDTGDTFICDLAVGLGAEFIRVGGLCRGERVAKLNRLLQIETELKSREQLASWPERTFPKITVPPPREEPPVSTGTSPVKGDASTSSPRKK